MPILNGYQACKELKELFLEEEITSFPIIACTADATFQNN